MTSEIVEVIFYAHGTTCKVPIELTEQDSMPNALLKVLSITDYRKSII